MWRRSAWVLAIVVLLAMPRVAAAPPETAQVIARRGFDDTVTRVEQAVEAHSLVHIATASASRAAAGRGIEIPGNAVVLAFNNVYAVRLLTASVPAGIEAPMRFYVTANADGTTTISYQKPSALLRPYGDNGLGTLGRELDDLFAEIVAEASR